MKKITNHLPKTNNETLKLKSQTAFSKQADTYDESMQSAHARRLYPHIEHEVLKAVASLPAPHLLDLGSGTGALSAQIFDSLPHCHLYGIDLSPEMVEKATKRLEAMTDKQAPISFLVGDAEHLPFHDASFDAVWCNDSFHHYPDPKRAAFEIWRVLKPGGTFVLGDVWQAAPARALMNAWIPYSKEGDVRIYSEEELRSILGTWFSEIAWKRIGSTACLATARKEK